MFSFQQGEGGIWIVGVDGSDLTQVVPLGVNPAWSPDGTRISYGQLADSAGGGPLRIADADGSDVTEFSYGGSGAWNPLPLLPASPATAKLVLQGQAHATRLHPNVTTRMVTSLAVRTSTSSPGTRAALFHYGLVTGDMPYQGVVEFRIKQTSADGRRTHELVQRIVDGSVVEQYLLDPSTGGRLDIPYSEPPYGMEGDGVPDRGGADFTAQALRGLGEKWTWVASISVNGTVVDSCDRTNGRL